MVAIAIGAPIARSQTSEDDAALHRMHDAFVEAFIDSQGFGKRRVTPMMVRMPLVPWIMASHGMGRSQTCQNGLDHRPATNAMLMRCTPPSRTFMISRWPSTRKIRTMPEIRMNSQE